MVKLKLCHVLAFLSFTLNIDKTKTFIINLISIFLTLLDCLYNDDLHVFYKKVI